MGSSEAGKNACPCPTCGETFDKRIRAYLAHRLYELRLCSEDSTSRRFSKSEQPASVPYDQFLKLLFGSHGVQGSGLRSPVEVSA